MQPLVVWTEIPVTDLSKSADFYADVFGWKMEMTQMGPDEVVIFNALGADEKGAIGGHLYAGKPAAGSTIHLALPDTVEAAAQRCVAAGGELMGPIIEIPPGRFQYATDLDGNSLGLFEPKAA